MYISGEGLVPVIKEHGEDLKVVEIGVCRAETSCYLMENCPNIKVLYGIDPWLPYQDKPTQPITATMQDEFFKTAIKNIVEKGLRGKIRIIKRRSDKIVTSFLDNSVDVLFVDGDHRFEAVLNDLEIWWPKLKKGGIMAGHDYGVSGVMQALDRFKKYNNIETVHRVKNAAWYFYKN